MTLETFVEANTHRKLVREKPWLRTKGRKGEIVCALRRMWRKKKMYSALNIISVDSRPSRLLCRRPDTWRSRIRDIACERRNYRLKHKRNVFLVFLLKDTSWANSRADEIGLTFLPWHWYPCFPKPLQQQTDKLVDRYLA